MVNQKRIDPLIMDIHKCILRWDLQRYYTHNTVTDIHNWILDINNSVMGIQNNHGCSKFTTITDIHNSIIVIHKCVMDIHNYIIDIQNCTVGNMFEESLNNINISFQCAMMATHNAIFWMFMIQSWMASMIQVYISIYMQLWISILLKNILKCITDVHDWITDIPNWIKDIHNWIRDIHNRMAWQWAETLVEIMGNLSDIRGTTQ